MGNAAVAEELPSLDELEELLPARTRASPSPRDDDEDDLDDGR